jgi:hypothetical protein
MGRHKKRNVKSIQNLKKRRPADSASLATTGASPCAHNKPNVTIQSANAIDSQDNAQQRRSKTRPATKLNELIELEEEDMSNTSEFACTMQELYNAWEQGAKSRRARQYHTIAGGKPHPSTDWRQREAAKWKREENGQLIEGFFEPPVSTFSFFVDLAKQMQAKKVKPSGTGVYVSLHTLSLATPPQINLQSPINPKPCPSCPPPVPIQTEKLLETPTNLPEDVEGEVPEDFQKSLHQENIDRLYRA